MIKPFWKANWPSTSDTLNSVPIWGLPWQSSGEDSSLPLWTAQVPSDLGTKIPHAVGHSQEIIIIRNIGVTDYLCWKQPFCIPGAGGTKGKGLGLLESGHANDFLKEINSEYSVEGLMLKPKV